MKARRLGPGAYEVTDGRRVVTIVRNPELRGPAKWVAFAGWDRFLVTDPLMTLAEAKVQAEGMVRS